jgi:nucleoside 2-deoxyribosyltransferase
MKIFVICSVRGMDDEYRKKLELHVDFLERAGNKVHLPHRDTDQTRSGIEICEQNAEAIRKSDCVHVFYNSKSQGTHFDMGVAFALGKNVLVIESEPYEQGTNFARMLSDWEKR